MSFSYCGTIPDSPENGAVSDLMVMRSAAGYYMPNNVHFSNSYATLIERMCELQRIP